MCVFGIACSLAHVLGRHSCSECSISVKTEAIVMCFVLIEATLPVATKLCSGIHPGLNPLPNFISMSAIGELRKYGHVSAVCTSHEVERMQKLAEVSKEFLRTRAETFVRSNSQRPLIITLGADCAP